MLMMNNSRFSILAGDRFRYTNSRWYINSYASARTHRFILVKSVGVAVSELCCFATYLP